MSERSRHKQKFKEDIIALCEEYLLKIDPDTKDHQDLSTVVRQMRDPDQWTVSLWARPKGAPESEAVHKHTISK